mmetsp:Transcript_83697/g.236239  ORF Transcript_83697/g.236239 Transcript_83697/m.236239 type:complete len:233 (-) Transcript_83697:267-965(-)
MTCWPGSTAVPTPSICVKSSVFSRRLASCSLDIRRDEAMASSSSIKTIEGAYERAMLNKQRMIFSLSPRYLDTSIDALQLKNVLPFMPATALASIVLPVPGGPNNSTPFHGSRMPTKNSGTRTGRMTDSSSRCLASSSAAMSSKVIPRFRSIMSSSTCATSSGLSSPMYILGSIGRSSGNIDAAISAPVGAILEASTAWPTLCPPADRFGCRFSAWGEGSGACCLPNPCAPW